MSSVRRFLYYKLRSVVGIAIVFLALIIAPGQVDAVAGGDPLDSSLAGETGIPSYSELMAHIAAAYESRSELLQHSSGRACLSIEETKVPLESTKKRYQTFLTDLGLDAATLVPVSATGQWSVEWYRNGTKNRCDVRVSDTDAPLSLFLPTNMRVVSDSHKAPYSVYYDVLAKRVYVYPAPLPLHRSFGLFKGFDIQRLYEFDGRPFPAWLAANEETKGPEPDISAGSIDGIPCFKITFDQSKTSDSGTRCRKVEFWVASKMSFSLLRARYYDNAQTHLQELKLIASYDATYRQSTSFEGVWLLSHLQMVDYRPWGPGRLCDLDYAASKQLEVIIEETRLSAAIPEEIFTLQGLGIPIDTKIYDAAGITHPLSVYSRYLW